MLVGSWESLPDFMRTPEVRPYYEHLKKKNVELAVKRVFDILLSILLIVILGIPMIIIAIMIKHDSKGPVFYRQERVTQNGKVFRIHKFRTMQVGADKIGSQVTLNNDDRITPLGEKLRAKRIDEFPQLFDILSGYMTFVGTRPEVPKYVKQYANEYYATLLLPAGLTSPASISFKDEALEINEQNVDEIYLRKILPNKMKSNLDYLQKFTIFSDLFVMIKTVFSVSH